MPTAKLNSKRIDSVTIKRMLDTNPDTSWLGEYSDKPNSKYSLDRAHSEDCPINTGLSALSLKTRTLANVYGECECSDQGCSEHEGKEDCKESANTILYRVDMQDASGTLMCDDCANDATMSGLFVSADDIELEEPECDCTQGGQWDNREYRYFNPGSIEPFRGESHTTLDGTTMRQRRDLWEKDMRENARRDYERMEAYNNQQWCFVGIRAEAEIVVSGICQTITSGGLWGIESDSHPSYFAEVESEQLSELRKTLESLGFSKRAISTAFKSVQHKEE